MSYISPWDIENAEKILSKLPDGSKANSTARLKAAQLLRCHAAHLLAFASVNRNTPIFDILCNQANALIEYAEKA